MSSTDRQTKKASRGGIALAALIGALAVLLVPGAAFGTHWAKMGWVDDHSATAIFTRPSGLAAINSTFGQASLSNGVVTCPAAANDASVTWPNAVANGTSGRIYYHSKLSINMGNNIRGHIGNDHKDNSTSRSAGGYSCRLKTGSSTQISVHAWGAAIDTNTARNPYGQTTWNGIGADGVNYGNYLPNVFTSHNFYWGLNFSGTKDPMHFQYATGY